jgi:hypothetical protein
MTTYQCAPAIVWVKDARQTLLVDQGRGQRWALHGAEAAIWDLLTLNYPFGRMAGFLSDLLGVSARDAAQQLLDVLHTWEQAGIVEAFEGNRRG